MGDSTEGMRVVSFVGEGPASFVSGTAEFVSGSTEFKTIVGVSSVSDKSGSVAHGDLCNGVEDNRCSLLASMMPSLPKAAIGVVDGDGTE